MKNMQMGVHFGLIALLAGCASHSEPLVIDPIGPENRNQANISPEGTLVVFSRLEEVQQHIEFDPSDSYSHYSGYEIWSKDCRKRLQLVSNHRFPYADDEPTRVELQPGHYFVKAKSTSYKWVFVPVEIVANRVTSIHLEGGLGVDKTHASLGRVYLPNGEIVGARAQAENQAP